MCVLIETQADSSRRQLQPHPLASTTSEQHKNNWKEKEGQDMLHTAIVRTTAQVAQLCGVLCTRCQSTGRSQSWRWQLVDCRAVWGVLALPCCPLITASSESRQPARIFYLFLHLALFFFSPHTFQSCGVGKLLMLQGQIKAQFHKRDFVLLQFY